MKHPGPRPRKYFVLASVFLAMAFLISCKPTTPSLASTFQPSTEKIFVVFDGPWAFAPDPRDPASVVAIAPKTKGHRDLYVKASNQSTLAAGTYDLSFPAHSGRAAATADPGIAQARVDAESLQRALDNKSARYTIRLPKPEQYLVAARSKGRLGPTYPPDASTERDYATAVSLRYNVSSLSGFSLSGTPDSGAFNPLLLQVETPTIRFVLEPARDDDPRDRCDTQSRESFHDLVTLLGLTLYVDFGDNPDDCHSKDPQNLRSDKATIGDVPRLGRLDSPLEGNLVEGQLTSASWTGPANHAKLLRRVPGVHGSAGYLAALYFFVRPLIDCHGPDLILTPGQ